jgi:hypothetical protein
MPSMRALADLGRTTKAVRRRHATAWIRATNDKKSHAEMPPLHRDDVFGQFSPLAHSSISVVGKVSDPRLPSINLLFPLPALSFTIREPAARAYTPVGSESEITDLTDHTDRAGVRAAANLEQEIRGSRSK